MSELTTENTNRKGLHEYLFSTVCAGAIFLAAGHAAADEVERPAVWIELGGQLERLVGNQEVFSLPFLNSFDEHGFASVLPVQRGAHYSSGIEGTLELDPRGTDWIFSASVRYGRSNASRSRYQRQPEPLVSGRTLYGRPLQTHLDPAPHLNASSKNAETHAVVDFSAGRDVGVGLLSKFDQSKVSFGIRIAQFTSNTRANINGVPIVFRSGTNAGAIGGVFTSHRHFSGYADVLRSFRAVGPSITWTASTGISRPAEDKALNFDWGINASLLFGRQKVHGRSDAAELHYKTFLHISTFAFDFYKGVASSYQQPHSLARSRSVIVPDVGGFAAVSFRYASAKVTLGYRGDFFFGAMDDGINARKSSDIGFYGPFATISIGLGG